MLTVFFVADEAEVCLSGATDGEIIKGSNEEEVSGSNETAGMITEEGNDVKSHTTTHGDSLYELEPADENCAFRMGEKSFLRTQHCVYFTS